jgi:hypothetical protein
MNDPLTRSPKTSIESSKKPLLIGLFILGVMIVIFVAVIYNESTNYTPETHSPNQLSESQVAGNLEVDRREVVKTLLNAEATYKGHQLRSLRDYFVFAKIFNEAEGKALEINGWNVVQRPDKKWVATFSWTFLGNEEQMIWLYDARDKTILALNEAAAEVRLRIAPPTEPDEQTPKRRKHH